MTTYYTLLKRCIFALLALGAAVAFSVAPASAAAKQTPTEYIKQLGDRALDIIGNKALSKPEKRTRIEAIFAENVDFPWVSRFVMGRYWREATDAQKKRYQSEYQKFLLLHYSSRFTEYNNGTFKITAERDDGEGEYTVTMMLKSDEPGAEAVQVDYRVRVDEDHPGKYQVFDLVVEGVSMLATQRSEFAAVIQTKGLDYLIDQLVQRTLAPVKSK